MRHGGFAAGMAGIVFAAVIGLATARAGNATGAQAAGVRVTIKVSDEAGKPVEGATIWLLDSFRPAYVMGDAPEAEHLLAGTVSAKDGVGEIQFVPKGFDQLIVVAENYAPQYIAAPPLSADKAFEVRLYRGQTISGTVRTEDGRPVTGATVKGTRQKDNPDFMSQFYPTATTDGRGRFELAHVAPGQYEVATAAEQPVYVDPVNTNVGVRGAGKALELVAKPGAVVKGKFVRGDGRPVGRMQVEMYVRRPKAVQGRTWSAGDGTFVVYGIPPGSRGSIYFGRDPGWSAQVEWAGKPAGCEPGLEAIGFQNLEPGMYEGVVVKLYQPAVLTGRVVDEKGKPYEQAVVMVMPLGRGRNADAEGNFSVELPPGLDSTVRVSNADTEETPAPMSFHPKEGETIEKTITLRRKTPFSGFELTGRVVDEAGKPVIGAQVWLGNSGILAPDAVAGGGRGGVKPVWSGGMFGPAATKTDGEGKFRFDKLLAGKSEVWADEGQLRWGYVKDVESNGDVKIVVREAPARATFDGVLEDAGGKPAAGARVWLYDGDYFRPVLRAETTSDERGSFALGMEVGGDRFSHVRLLCRNAKGDVAWKTLPKIGSAGIRVRFREDVTVEGRVVNKHGEGLAGARVWMYVGRDPDDGYMIFYRDVEAFAPETVTDAEGRYRLGHVPKGNEITVVAKHAEYEQGGGYRTKDVGPGTRVADISLNDGASVEGMVRLPDGKPAAGATVSVMYFERPEVSVKTDGRGAYRLSGLRSGSYKLEYRIVATLGNGPQWEGSPVQGDVLTSGDRVKGWDIELDKSKSVRIAEWRAHAVAPRASKYGVAVLDDCDPAVRGRRTYHDTLTVYDGNGKEIWKYGDLNIRYGGALAGDPKDRSVYVYESGADRLVKFSSEGARAWSQARGWVENMVVDPASGNVLVPGPKAEAIDRDGKHVADLGLSSPSMAYDAHSRSVWATTVQAGGLRPVRAGMDGKVLIQSTFSLEAIGTSVAGMAVSETDGSLWLALGVQRQISRAHNQIVVIGEDGQLVRQIELGDEWPSAIAVDGKRGVVWLAGGLAVYKMSVEGVKVLKLPVTGELCVEPDTGCVWVAAREGVFRVSPAGELIWSKASAEESHKRICLVDG
jgi:protocatechuate 3,4-dioxygenase beta subunit